MKHTANDDDRYIWAYEQMIKKKIKKTVGRSREA